MKKNKFITSTIILIIGGAITKVLSMVIKIITTRIMGPDGIGLYMLINPTFILFISLCTLGMPTAISKLVSEEKRNNKKIILNASTITILVDIILMALICLFAKVIAYNLLHEPRVLKAIMAMGFVLPFISISSILRGYFFGKQKMLAHVISNIIEDIVRLLSITLFVPLYLAKGIEYAVYFLVTCLTSFENIAKPNNNPIKKASTVNICKISILLAPTDLNIPISLVRSITEI